MLLGGCVSPSIMVAPDEISVGLFLCYQECPAEVPDLHNQN